MVVRTQLRITSGWLPLIGGSIEAKISVSVSISRFLRVGLLLYGRITNSTREAGVAGHAHMNNI